jgi:hypothetical protein
MSLYDECQQVLSETHYINEARRCLRSQFSFRNLVHMYGFKPATNPRDKIFGLLGLTSKNVSQSLSPNYTLNPNEVFEIAFRTMFLEESGSLECLLGSWFNSNPSSAEDPQDPPVANLPSWVPNFTNTISHRLCRAELNRRIQYDLYDASRGRTSQVSLSENSTLHGTGCRVGKVRVISEFNFEAKTTSIREHLKQWLHHTELTVGEFDPIERQAFWRTVLGDLLHNPDPSSLDTVGWTRITARSSFSFETWFAEENGDVVQDHKFVTSLDAATYGRAFFRTESGAMGLCPPHTKPGDEIWVLCGGRVPFMLRPRSEEEGRYHTFIGDCYLDGVMSGEATSNPLYKVRTIMIK